MQRKEETKAPEPSPAAEDVRFPTLVFLSNLTGGQSQMSKNTVCYATARVCQPQPAVQNTDNITPSSTYETRMTHPTSSIQINQNFRTSIQLLSTHMSILLAIILYNRYSICSIAKCVCQPRNNFQVVVLEGLDSSVKRVTSVLKNRVEKEAFSNKSFVLATTIGAGNVAIAIFKH